MKVSVNDSPRTAGSMVPRNVPPISAGLGWLNRRPSVVITTTKSVPVSTRTCSAKGCSTALGSFADSASRTVGVSASACAMPSTSSWAPAELAALACE